MLLVVSLHGLFEVGESVVYVFIGSYIYFSRSGPEHYNTVAAMLFLEVADIFAESFYHFPAGLALHDVITVKTLCVVVVESCLHGDNLFKLVLYGKDIFFLENLGVHSRFESVGGIYVPRAEFDVVEVGDGHNLVVMEIFLVGTFAYAHDVVLGH